MSGKQGPADGQSGVRTPCARWPIVCQISICWGVVYACVTGTLWAFQALGIALPLALQTLLLTLVLVPAMVLVISPASKRLVARLHQSRS